MPDDFVILVNGLLFNEVKAPLAVLTAVCTAIIIFAFAASAKAAGKPGQEENSND